MIIIIIRHILFGGKARTAGGFGMSLRTLGLKERRARAEMRTIEALRANIRQRTPYMYTYVCLHTYKYKYIYIYSCVYYHHYHYYYHYPEALHVCKTRYLRSAPACRTILYYTMLCYTILYYTMLCYTILYYTVLYCTIL